MSDFPTLRDLFEEAVRSEPASQVFTRWYANGAWQTRTYAQTQERVRALAEWFGQQGLEPRQTRVALMLPNSPAWVECYLAVCGLAGIVVHVDPKLTTLEVHHILADSGATLVITDRAHLARVAEAAPTLPDLRGLLLTDAPQAGDPLPCPCETMEAAIQRCSSAKELIFWNAPGYRPVPDDLCGLLYTSGTTGKPKGAMLTHRNFTADAMGTLGLLTGFITAQDDFLVVLPLFHAFAFTTDFVIVLCTHARLSFVRSLRTLAEDLSTLHSSVLMTVPLMSEKLHARLVEKVCATAFGRLLYRFFPRRVGRRLHAALGGGLRLIIVGGAKADAAVLKDFNRLGFTRCEGYGLTECAPVVAVNPPNRIRPGSIGPAVCGIEVRLAHPDGQGVGELQVRGPINFRGYWRNEAATEATFEGDWLKTGDLAAQDGDGYLTIRGRAKALIVNREGKNIYPEEVEQAIVRDPLVGQVVVLAYQAHGEPGEKVGALVAPNTELLERLHPQATPAEVEKLLREAVKRQCAALAAYKHPRKVVVSPEPLALTSTQKVRRHLYAGTLDEP